MAGRIRDADIALVRERSRIDDVIGEHVQLRPAGGGNLRGLCPFHDEKTPSFNVRTSTGVYYCFGCQQGGDVIGFVRAVDGLTFPEAVERLARRAGITLTYEGGGATSRTVTSQRQRLLEAHRAAAEFYAETLSSAPSARPGWELLAARGFDRDVVERFGVGYAPTGWDQLTRHLMGRRFTAEELVIGGLAKPGSRGSLIDRFHHRLMWPIRDLAGDVVGFGGRRLAADDEEKAGPKYLNTPETPLFKKSHLLYGADLARREIARRYQVVVVEGYTDVMACHLAGVTTAVAACGTAFGSEHVGVVRRLLMDNDFELGKVVFTFDGDAAGQKAATRAFEFEEQFVTQTYVAVEPNGLDPCDLRLIHGDAAVRELVASRVPLYTFAIRGVVARYDLNTVDGRLAALDAAAPLINRIKDLSLRDRYAVETDRWIGLNDEKFVRRRVAEHRGRAQAGSPGSDAAGLPGVRATQPRRQVPTVEADGPTAIVERETLKIALQYPGLAGPIFDALTSDVFTLPEHRAVRDAIALAGGVCAGLIVAGDVPTWVGTVVAMAEDRGDAATVRLVTSLAVQSMLIDHEVDDRYVGEQLARLQELHVTRRIAELKSRVQRLNPVSDLESYNRDFGELIALEQHKRELRERGVGAA
jgi:DNA primase